MARHYELAPDGESVALLVAQRALDVAQNAGAKPSGTVATRNADGSLSLAGPDAGVTGNAQWVGDTTVPGVPTGVDVSSRRGVLIVRWDGSLTGGVPDDFSHVSVYATWDGLVEPVTVGSLAAAGELVGAVAPVGTSVSVYAVAFDLACDEYGCPNPNISARTSPVTVVIEPLVSQAELDAKAKEILSAADKAAEEQIKQVNETIAAHKELIDQNTNDVEAGTLIAQQAADAAATAEQNAANALNDISALTAQVSHDLETISDAVQDNKDGLEAAKDIAEKAKKKAEANATAIQTESEKFTQYQQDVVEAQERTEQLLGEHGLKLDAVQSLANSALDNASELLANPGFEEGETGWNISPAGKSFVQESLYARSGKYRAYLNVGLGTYELVSSRAIPVVFGQRYRISCWYKLVDANGATSGGLRIQYSADGQTWEYGENRANLDFSRTNDSWSQLVYEFVADENIRFVRARFAANVPIGCYLDDFTLTNVTLSHAAQETASKAKQSADNAVEQVNRAVELAEQANGTVLETVASTIVEYAVGADSVTAPSSGWSTVQPKPSGTQVVWMRTKIVRVNNQVSYSSPVPVTGPQGVKGDAGENGLPGAKGADGRTSYLHIAYATSADGSQGFSTTVSDGKTFIGQYTDFTQADSTDRTKYAWSRIQGPQGPQGVAGHDGADGLPGAKGADGKTSYLHIAYATSADGRQGFSTTVSEGKTYIGQYTDFTQADSTDPAKYLWSLIKGPQGATGPQGPQGLKGDPGATGLPGAKGEDGRTSYIHFAYATSADGRQGFSVSDGTGKTYIGQYTDFTEADSTDPSKYTWTKVKGEQGVPGVKGDPGAQGVPGEKGADGRTSYAHFAYANSADGRTDFSVSDGTNRAYIGQYVDFTQADSTDPTKYTWTLVKGPQGATGPQGPQGEPGHDGKNGLPGPAGADGRTSYLHIAYATSADGKQGFSVSVSEGKTYIGQYTDFTEADSTDPTKYLWTLIKGPQGATGATGVSVTGITTFYALALSKPTQPTVKEPPSPWTVTEPGYDRDKKLYTASRVDYSNGQFSWTAVQLSSSYAIGQSAETAASSAVDVANQAAASTIVSSVVEYAVADGVMHSYWEGEPNNSVSVLVVPQLGAWSATSPVLTGEQVAWMRTTFTYGDGRTETTEPVRVTGAQGPQGLKGDPGATGLPGAKGEDGRTSYIHFAYATSADGRQGFSVSDGTGKTYIGQYTDFVEEDSTDPTKYTWTRVKGEQGPQGVQGPQGNAGVSVKSITDYYRLSLNTPAQPASKEPGAGWSTVEPEFDKTNRNMMMYTCSRVDYTNDSFSWTNVQMSSAYKATSEAWKAADDAAEQASTADTYASQAQEAANTAAGSASAAATTASNLATTAGTLVSDAQKAATSAQAAANAALANAAELLENPGFENGNVGWSISPADKAFVQESPWSRSGERRAYLNIGLGTRDVTSTKAIPVTNGQRYRLSVWYKLTDAGDATSAGLRFQWSGDGNTWHDFAGNPDIDLDTANSDWWQLSKDIVAANGTKYVRARFAANAPIDCYLDDFSLKDITLAYEAQQTANAAYNEAKDAKDTAANLETQATLAQAAANNAQTTADAKNTIYTSSSDPRDNAQLRDHIVPGDLWWQTNDKLETYWEGEPNNSVSVLVDHSDEIKHMWVWNGLRWNSHTMYAQDLLVNGSVTANQLSANALYSKVMEGGEFRTTPKNGITALQINNTGLLMTGPSGETTVSMLASTGDVTFNGVNINDGDLFSPNITAGTIVGSDFTLKDKVDGTGNIIGRLNSAGMWFGESSGNKLLSFGKVDNKWKLVVKGDITSGSTITGAKVQTSPDDRRGVKLLGNGQLNAYKSDGTLMFAVDTGNETVVINGASLIGGDITGMSITGGAVNGCSLNIWDNPNYAGAPFIRLNSSGMHVGNGLTYAQDDNGEWKLSINGAIQSGGQISGATVVGGAIRTNTQWESPDPVKKFRGLVITDGGMFAYKNNGEEEYSMAFTAATGELKLDGAISTNAVFEAPTISAGQMVGTNIYTSTDADNRVSVTSAGLTVTHGGNTVISFTAGGAVDLGTSGIAADSRVSDLTDEVHGSYTPLAMFEQTTGVLADSVTDVQTQVGATADRLDEEIVARKQYMRFDPDTGLTIGDLTNAAAYSVQLTSTAMQFRAGNTVAAYVSNDRLYINNAEVVNTLRIGNFAFLPRDNGHMSLQYVGGQNQ